MSVQTMERPFKPAAPRRPEKAYPVWSRLFGEPSRNPIMAWTADSFRRPYMSSPLFSIHYHAVSEPDSVKRILLDNQANYGKPALLKTLFPILADGLFGAEGELWRGQRRLMAPVFTPGAIAEFLPVFADIGRSTAERWVKAGPRVVDVSAEATGATFDIISRTLFSGEHGLSGEEAAHHVAAMLASAGEVGALNLLGLRGLDWSARGRAGRAGEAFLEARLKAFIADRQAMRDPPQDFMTRLIEAFAQDHPPPVAARMALANAVTFLVAGHDTTSNALAWAIYLLSEQPQAQAWAAEEAREALNVGKTPAEVLDHLVYLRWVLDETLRLYPPAPRIERQAAEDDQLGDLTVRKGDMVGVWPWLLHRHEALWDEPDRFNPETFSPEGKAAQHRFQYIPFGAGPRICIGAQFATAEALLILTHWLARVEFSPVPGHTVEVAGDLTLKPKGGMPIRVRPRAG